MQTFKLTAGIGNPCAANHTYFRPSSQIKGIEYSYVFSQDGKWLYFPAGEEYEWRNLKEDLENDTIHLAEPDEELIEELSLSGEDWDESPEEDDIEQEMYGGI